MNGNALSFYSHLGQRGPLADAIAVQMLFAANQQGALYIPEPQYLYQDSAGTTPVTADNDPVGLMLDTRLGATLGSEALNSPNFETPADWSTLGSSTVSVGSANVLSTDGSFSAITQNNRLTTGQWYEMTYEITDSTSGSIRNDAESGTPEITSTVGTHTRIFRASGTHFQLTRFGGVTDITLSSVSVKTLSGNHATQSTSASRPVYNLDGGKHNLDFDAVDDVLVATFPDLGTDATIAYSTSAGVTILTNQTISGSTNLPVADFYGLIIYDRPFTDTQTAQVTRYLNRLAGL